MVAERWVSASGIAGLWPANSVGDDIVVYADEQRTVRWLTLHTLRQQLERDAAHPNHALVGLRRPGEQRRGRLRRRVRGHHRPSASSGRSQQFERENDDYSAILSRRSADRLAEAFAERMHERVRREGWGYAADESLSREQLIAEGYRGIRPAPGYGCQPDHTEKATLFELLERRARDRIELTESFAMRPGSSVLRASSSPTRGPLFGVGRIGATSSRTTRARKGWTIEEAARWLGADPRQRRQRAAGRRLNAAVAATAGRMAIGARRMCGFSRAVNEPLSRSGRHRRWCHIQIRASPAWRRRAPFAPNALRAPDRRGHRRQRAADRGRGRRAAPAARRARRHDRPDRARCSTSTCSSGCCSSGRSC